MVRIEGSGSVPRSRRASKIASAPLVAQVALLSQLPPQVQDQVLDVGRCALRRVGDGR